jgi:hypothetical protein
MSNLHRRFLASLVLTLTACGGGTDSSDTRGELAAASSVKVTEVTGLPVYRTQLQSFEAANPTAITSQYPSASTGTSVTAPLAPLPSAAVADAASDRAMWTWHDVDVSTAARQNTLLNFAAERGVNVIFLHSEDMLDKPKLLSAFLTRAAAKGMKVELLFGASTWALTANHNIPLQLLKRVNTFVSGLSGARPVGVHFDIEPHALPEWNTDPVSLGNQLLSLYGKLMAAKAPGLYINADIAMGYEYLSLTRGGVTKSLSHWMVDSTDRTTLMDYRDYSSGEDSILSHALHPVSYAAIQRKRTVVGVETTCNVQPTKVTFCEEGNRHMETQLSTVNTYFRPNAGYGGIAIHDYANYRKLTM